MIADHAWYAQCSHTSVGYTTEMRARQAKKKSVPAVIAETLVLAAVRPPREIYFRTGYMPAF